MSTPFQNRLVGTIIVAAALIIFLPDIFDGEKESYQADFEAIPQAPTFAKTQSDKTFPQDKFSALPENKLSEEQSFNEQPIDEDNNINKTLSTKIDIDNKNIVDEPNLIDKVKPESNQPMSTQPDKAVIEQAWVIHLGSFRHEQNVKELLVKLKQNGYTAFTKPIKTKNGTLTKVFVGPELIKSSLERKLPKLNELTKVKGRLAPFYANK